MKTFRIIRAKKHKVPFRERIWYNYMARFPRKKERENGERRCTLRYDCQTKRGGGYIMNKREVQFWLKYCYPTTIINDRYNGAYSGAKWLAFPIDYYQVPEDIDSGDTECMMFWESYTECVGKGNTIEEAFDDLVIKMKRL